MYEFKYMVVHPLILPSVLAFIPQYVLRLLLKVIQIDCPASSAS